jgi:hypothetical protein
MMAKKEPKKNLDPKELEDYEPGTTKAQFFEALRIVSKPKDKPTNESPAKPSQA